MTNSEINEGSYKVRSDINVLYFVSQRKQWERRVHRRWMISTSSKCWARGPSGRSCWRKRRAQMRLVLLLEYRRYMRSWSNMSCRNETGPHVIETSFVSLATTRPSKNATVIYYRFGMVYYYYIIYHPECLFAPETELVLEEFILTFFLPFYNYILLHSYIIQSKTNLYFIIW